VIKIQLDAVGAAKLIRDINATSQQLRAAEGWAVNAAAIKGRKAFSAHLARRVDRPTPYTRRGPSARLHRTDKRAGRVQAYVFVKRRQFGYLRILFAGGIRAPTQGRDIHQFGLGIAARDAPGKRFDKYGNTPGLLQRARGAARGLRRRQHGAEILPSGKRSKAGRGYRLVKTRRGFLSLKKRGGNYEPDIYFFRRARYKQILKWAPVINKAVAAELPKALRHAMRAVAKRQAGRSAISSLRRFS